MTNARIEAEKLRKENKYKEALVIYKQEMTVNCDEKLIAGCLNCLRKLQLKEEALVIAKDSEEKFKKNWKINEFNWLRVEVFWSFIQFILNKENNDIYEVELYADKIVTQSSDSLINKKAIQSAVRVNKIHKKWDRVLYWSEKLSLEDLNAETISDGQKGWSEDAVWFNNRIHALIELDRTDDALEILKTIDSKFSKLDKYFKRLKALALHKKGALNEAAEIYRSLYSDPRVDWWIKREYGNVIKDQGKYNEALKIMYDAAFSNGKLEMEVGLFEEIAVVCEKLEKWEEARLHYLLGQYIKVANKWKVSNELNNKIDELSKKMSGIMAPTDRHQALNKCKEHWKLLLDRKPFLKDDRKPIKGLKGKILLVSENKPFCFIVVNEERYFCLKNVLSQNSKNEDLVVFDAYPSFDNIKQKRAWRAKNIMKA